MDTLYFHIDSNNIDNDQFILGIEESHHFLNVLRKPIGVEIWLIDGKGSAYKAVTESILNKQVQGKILEHIPMLGENGVNVHLTLGILKGDRLKLAIEKATEMGVASLTLVNMDHCIKRDVKIDKLNKIVMSAAKQCGRSVIPNLSFMKSFEKWMSKNDNSKVFVCALDESKYLSNIYDDESISQNDVHIVIGPEGDFSKREIEMMKKNDFTFISLGPRRLRSETAVVTVLAVINELIALN